MPPILLVTPPGPSADRLRAGLEGLAGLRVLPDVASLLEEDGFPEATPAAGEAERGVPGGTPRSWILMGPDLEAQERTLLLARAADRRGRWGLLDLRDGDEGFEAVPVSVGFPESLETALSRAVGEEEPPVLELHEVLERVSRARHDLNNPLTAAMAETQLLLMDVEEGTEAHEAMVVVQKQLERIRDLIAELRNLRPPREES